MLPKNIGNARILSFGYDAAVTAFFGRTSSDTILQHAHTLVAELVADRQLEGAVNRPIIFLCHSLGGIVVKRVTMLRLIHWRKAYLVLLGSSILSQQDQQADPTFALHIRVDLRSPFPRDTPSRERQGRSSVHGPQDDRCHGPVESVRHGRTTPRSTQGGVRNAAEHNGYVRTSDEKFPHLFLLGTREDGLRDHPQICMYPWDGIDAAAYP